jgi:hypothetical protein
MSEREPDRELIAGLRRLAEDTVVPPLDPAQEQRLLAAFDDRHSSVARARRRAGRRAAAAIGLLAAAAAIVFAVTRPERAARPLPPLGARNPIAQGIPAMLARAPESARISLPDLLDPRERPDRSVPSFVMWPGAHDLPRFESGQLMRVEMPASVVLSLGLRPSRPLRNDGTVQTDVLVGQDGFARAVRLVQ